MITVMCPTAFVMDDLMITRDAAAQGHGAQCVTSDERVVRFAASALRETRLTSRRACALGLASPSFAHASTLAALDRQRF